MKATETWTYDYETSTTRRGREGETTYVNQHFATEGEAWEKLIRETEAGVSLGASARRRARAELDRVTTLLADDAERLVKARDNFEAWKRALDGDE